MIILSLMNWPEAVASVFGSLIAAAAILTAMGLIINEKWPWEK
jgi:hypothetical protein